MRVDVEATKRMWRQTLWGTAVTMVGLVVWIVYVLMQPAPDYSSVRFLLVLLLLMPAGVGVAYLIRRFIESLAA